MASCACAEKVEEQHQMCLKCMIREQDRRYNDKPSPIQKGLKERRREQMGE